MPARRVFLITAALFAFASAIHAASPGASAFDYVHNGSFESGTDGWLTRHQSQLTTAGYAAVPDGSSVGRLSLGGDTFELRATTHGVLGPGDYALTAQVMVESPMTVALDVRGANLAAWTSTELAPGGWHAIVLPVEVTTATEVTVLMTGVGAPGTTLYIDAVRLDGAPPVTHTPTAWPTTAPIERPVSATPAPVHSPTPSPEPRLDVVAAHLRNTSFEEFGADGVPFAWDKFGGHLISSPSPARTGARAARFESNTTSTKWMYQTVLVEQAATYGFEAWIYQDVPNVATSLRISWYASADGSGEAISTAESASRLDTPAPMYRHLGTGPMTSPAGARSARLRVVLSPRAAAPATIFVDDASFGPTKPLPPTPPPSAGNDTAGPAGSARNAPNRSRASGGGVLAVSDSAPAGVSYDSTSLLINEVLYDPNTEGADAEAEWVEIYNTGTSDVSLRDWTLRDNAGASLLPDVVVPAGDFVVIAASDSFLTHYPSFDGVVAWLGGRLGNGLGNEGDRLELAAPSGAVIDAISWGDDASVLVPAIDGVPSGHSIERVASGVDTGRAADFIDNESPSPGTPLRSPSTLPKPRTSAVEVLEASGGGVADWLPWALVALSASALAGTVGWRAFDAVRGRPRAT